MRTEALPPYVSVAATTHASHISSVMGMANVLRNQYLTGRHVAVGIQISHDSLHGRTARFPNRFPNVNDLERWLPDQFDYLSESFRPGSSAIHRGEIHLHFSPGPKGSPHLFADLEELGDRIGRWVHGLKLNATFPNPGVLQDWADRFPAHRIILSVNSGMTESGRTPDELAYEIQVFYEDVITDILFDQSGGEGRKLEVARTAKWLTAIAKAAPEVRLGVAGGLGPNRLREYEELLAQFGQLNLDAERWLLHGEDQGLDLVRANTFIAQAGFLDYLHNVAPQELLR